MQRELLLLREMRDAAVAIQDLVGDWSAEQVEADQLRRPALLWHFTVLGEAASQVSSETRDSHSQIAWRAATRLATALCTVTGTSMSRRWSPRPPTTSLE